MSSCEKQCKWRNSVGKLQEERGSSTRNDTSDGDDSRASSARGTIIREEHSDALSRTICRIPSDPELLPPGAQCDLATSKVICFLDDNYAVIPTGVTGSSWKRQDFLIIEPTPPIIRHFSNSTRAKLKENPLVLVRNPETGQIERPFKLITWGKGYACVSTAVGPKWLAARHVKPYRVQTQAETDPKTGGREVGTQTKGLKVGTSYYPIRDKITVQGFLLAFWILPAELIEQTRFTFKKENSFCLEENAFENSFSLCHIRMKWASIFIMKRGYQKDFCTHADKVIMFVPVGR
ncbi:hypothetical protein DUI87_04973 [Hirundo rustica rustica]|uniref:Integrase-type domain-containing protein n=1 Tax=Hirundo rustica rustica TaxID=333673 RepID=A0A3M0L2V4_HIRRU|nr:hypothetical protein DUI87_04973 [Hirundo rustica rustica]